MRCFRARRLGHGAGPWFYSRMDDKVITPVGYCAGWREWTPEQLRMQFDEAMAVMVLRDQEQLRLFKHKYHTTGHATDQEARDCYKEYMIDNCVTLDHKLAERRDHCMACSELTDGYAQVGTLATFVLCDNCRNRVEIAKLFKVTETMYS